MIHGCVDIVDKKNFSIQKRNIFKGEKNRENKFPCFTLFINLILKYLKIINHIFLNKKRIIINSILFNS